jgi:hypothetical protein
LRAWRRLALPPWRARRRARRRAEQRRRRWNRLRRCCWRAGRGLFAAHWPIHLEPHGAASLRHARGDEHIGLGKHDGIRRGDGALRALYRGRRGRQRERQRSGRRHDGALTAQGRQRGLGFPCARHRNVSRRL